MAQFDSETADVDSLVLKSSLNGLNWAYKMKLSVGTSLVATARETQDGATAGATEILRMTSSNV